MIGSIFQVPVEFGTVIGYQHKIDPDPSYQNFSYPTSIESGIHKIAEKSHSYLKLKV